MKSFIKSLSFHKRDIPIPADYRPLYKIGHIMLILNISCRSNKATLMKLHFLCWAIKSKSNMAAVKQWVTNDFKNDYHIWGVEPTVNRAVTYAVAEGLVSQIDGDYIITEKGVSLYKMIRKDKEIFQQEKDFLNFLGKNGITEQRVKILSSKFL